MEIKFSTLKTQLYDFSSYRKAKGEIELKAFSKTIKDWSPNLFALANYEKVKLKIKQSKDWDEKLITPKVDEDGIEFFFLDLDKENASDFRLKGLKVGSYRLDFKNEIDSVLDLNDFNKTFNKSLFKTMDTLMLHYEEIGSAFWKDF